MALTDKQKKYLSNVILNYHKKFNGIDGWYNTLMTGTETINSLLHTDVNLSVKIAAMLLTFPLDKKKENQLNKLSETKKRFGLIMRHAVSLTWKNKKIKPLLEEYNSAKRKAKFFKSDQRYKDHLLLMTNLLLDTIVADYTLRSNNLKEILNQIETPL